MATSTCSQCEETKFELVSQKPTDAKYTFNFVQCASCGTVVGVVEERNIGSLSYLLEAMLRRIAEKVGADLTGI
jgi:heterodisulfide reductase subunit A-like polyferredoxin